MADRSGYIGRAPGDSSVTVAKQTFSPTGVTTDFTFASGYTVGYLDLFLNGTKLIEGVDYTATDASTISLVSAAINGDVLEGVAYKAFNLGDSRRIGIQSGGALIGNVDTLNFVGTGNSITLNGGTIDVSISGGGGGGITTANISADTLQVTGVSTISAGRIQADASSNLRFGNVAAGSGSGRNIAIGDQVLVSLNGGLGRNIGIGELSYYDTTSGQYNIGIGEKAGQKVTTGTYNVILGGYDGNSNGLDIRTTSNNVVIADGQGNIRQYINSSGNVGIKTTIITEAVTVAGIVSATSFYGTLNAEQLTGALPAINGSALTGVVGSGSGVIVENNATPVGTAGTINFGSNINVSFASGIATVSGNGLATYANVAGIATYATNAGLATAATSATYASTAGISTTSGTAGYATTAGISSAVSATININTTGIITATSFSGSGAT